ncbi:CD44 antigen [Misgurnus anguillicaudatus]|uniref:CD44 antigen n=1 Tax=Misgurnus anguillicaudatus TaxID=75329 RepID=UPI003CCF2F11
MWTLLLFMVAIGLPALFHTGPVHGQGGRYSFAGVLHVEGTSNYSLTFQQALELCQSLNYKLATLEQVIEAYKNGLRTCRYGWIDGKVVAFLPHINGPNCDSSSTDVTVHSEAATYLSDVYCFNPSVEKTNEDVLEEALIEGFLVELEKKTRNAAKETMPVAKTDLEDTTGSTNKFRFRRSSVVPVVLFPEEEGSGSGLDPRKILNDSEPQFTTTLPTTETAVTTTINEEVLKEVAVVPEYKNDPTLHTEKGGRKIDLEYLPSTPSGHQGKRTPAWLVIVATCVVVGAILCIFAAIATKDKWYGPRRSKNITPENYSKSATLPLSEKEKEIVTLMNIAILDNDKTQDIKASLEEHEKEYLM